MKLLAAKKYFYIMKLSIMEELSYRAAFFLNYLSTPITFAIYYVLWQLIYADQASVAGYTFPLLIATLFLSILFRSFINSAGQSEVIEQHFQKGTILVYLSRPIDFFGIQLFSLFGGLLLRFAFVIPFALLVQYYFLETFPMLADFLLALILIFLGIIVFFEIHFIIGTSSVWLGEIWGIETVFMYASWLFTGALVPIEFFPPLVRGVSFLIPFEHAVFIPTKFFLGEAAFESFLISFLILLIWVAGLFVFKTWFWNTALKAHDGKG